MMARIPADSKQRQVQVWVRDEEFELAIFPGD